MDPKSAVDQAIRQLGETAGYSVLHQQRWIKTLIQINDLCPPKTHGQLLDVGVWPGYQSLALSLTGYHVHGLDLQPSRMAALPLAIGRYDIIADTEMPVSAGTFDLVVATEIIEHIPPERLTIFLSAAHQALRSGGHLFITTPNRRYLGNAWRSRATGTDAAGHGHTHEFTTTELRRALSAPWQNVQVKTMTMYNNVGAINNQQYYRPLSRWWRYPRKIHNLLKIAMMFGQLLVPGRRDTLFAYAQKS
jgi:SAM-dependent methyltransferase